MAIRLFYPVGLSVCLASASVVGCAPAKPIAPVVQTENGIQISFSTNPSPPHTGADTVFLQINDSATNAPIGNANLSIEADAVAPQLPGSAVSGRAQGNGAYQAPVDFPIPTQYDVVADVTRPGQSPVSFTFRVDVEH